MTASEARQKALDTALGKIRKQLGDESIMRLGDKPFKKISVISTGSINLDAALGVGGLPVGRIIEIYGPESSGKTLLCLQAIAQVQKNGGIAAFLDVENALDPSWAKKVGVDTDNLLISQPGNAEDTLEIALKLVESAAVDLIVVDSVAALTPKKEIEGEMGDSMVGVQARLMSQAMRKITAPAAASGTTVIFINQLREKIGVMFGSPETTTGGKALKFYASVRLDIRRIGQEKSGDEVVGARTRVKVVKNKVAPPFRQAEYVISFQKGSEGISREMELIDLGVKYGFIKKAGAWFTLAFGEYAGQQLGQGAEKSRIKLVEEKKMAAELEALVRAEMIESDEDFIPDEEVAFEPEDEKE